MEMMSSQGITMDEVGPLGSFTQNGG